MQKNKKEKIPPEYNSYLVDFNISLLIPSAKTKKEAINRAVKSLESHSYVLTRNLLNTKIYE